MADMKEIIKEVVLEASASTDTKLMAAVQLIKQQQRQIDCLANQVKTMSEEQRTLAKTDPIGTVQQMILTGQKHQKEALQETINSVSARLQEMVASRLDRLKEFDKIEQTAVADHKKRINQINELHSSAAAEFILEGWYSIVLVLVVIITCFTSTYWMSNRTIACINEATGNLWEITGATWYNVRYNSDLQPEEFSREWNNLQKDKVDHPENWPRLYEKKE